MVVLKCSTIVTLATQISLTTLSCLRITLYLFVSDRSWFVLLLIYNNSKRRNRLAGPCGFVGTFRIYPVRDFDGSRLLQEEDREEAKEWVLAVSMDQRVQQVLKMDDRGCYEGSLTNTHNNVTSPQCILTGRFRNRSVKAPQISELGVTEIRYPLSMRNMWRFKIFELELLK